MQTELHVPLDQLVRAACPEPEITRLSTLLAPGLVSRGRSTNPY